nr:ATP-binding cassette domain-containing protein [Maritalea mediterranea]
MNLKDLTISLGDQVLFHLNAEIKAGEVLTVMGPSGSGKSTLLNAISGFLSPRFTCQGQIMLDGEDITHKDPSARHVGLMFQEPLLFPHMSVEENLLFALPRGGSKQERCEKVREKLRAVRLEELGARDPLTLSGGQQSRIALMRVLLSNPKALLLDEPFSSLDVDLRSRVRQFVFTQARENQLPVLMVTHDQADAEAANGPIINLLNHK